MGPTALEESDGAHEPHINEMRQLITLHIQQAIIPLIAYAHRYEPWTALVSLDLQDYIRCDKNISYKIFNRYAVYCR